MKRGDFGRFNDEEYHPIPITYEWLKKCGLIEENVFFPGEPIITSKGSVLIQCINNSSIAFYLPINTSIEVKYLHQLQNLHLTLTGEELQIKCHDTIQMQWSALH